MSTTNRWLAALFAANVALFGAASVLSAGGGSGPCYGNVDPEDCACSTQMPGPESQCLSVDIHDPPGADCAGKEPTPEFFCMEGDWGFEN